LSDELLGKHYKNLLDFIFKCDQLDSLKKVYELLNEFWMKEFNSSSIIIYSVFKEASKSRNCRQVWQSKNETKPLLQKELNSIRECLRGNEKIIQSWAHVDADVGNLYVFACGESFDQAFYAGLRTDDVVQTQIFDYLVTYLSNASQKYKKFSEADKLKSLVHIDDVTGLYNQRKFLKDIDDQILKFSETGEVFSVVFIDIDHFKSVNDGHGHLVGTQLLSDVAKVLKRVIRETDLCYRYGGDEFVIVVPTCDSKNAKEVGLRILRGITKESFYVSEEKGLNGSHTFSLSVSVGVATYPVDAKTQIEIISFADKMMYKAKQSGRGKVCCAGEMFTEDE